MTPSGHDDLTASVATAALLSPWWIPDIAFVSSTLGILLQLFGLAWLIVQIVSKLKGR